MAHDAMNPNSLTVSQLARLLSRAGSVTISEAMIQADLDAGAPRSADGTINLVHFTAWLVQSATNNTSPTSRNGDR